MQNIPVIFEDTNILVITKPSGTVVHPFDNSNELTLVDILRTTHPSIFEIENTMTLQDGTVLHLGGIVHKLDRDTSGVLIIAKNKKAFDALKHNFRNHNIQKIYVAVVDGLVHDEQFTINAPLGRNKKDYKQTVNPSNPRGELREAVTEVKVLARGTSSSLVELRPITGRTHQLRAHMTYIHHPIVGDKAYGSTIATERIMLHAQKISFILFQKQYTFEANLPEDFKAN